MPDEVLRPERRAARKLDVDAAAVLGEAHHLAAPEDRDPELIDHPAGQDALEVALAEREKAVVARREVGDVQGDLPESQARVLLPRRNETLRDPTLIEHLQGAGVQTLGSRPVEILAGAPFDDDDDDSRQRQLPRQRQPGRAASCDHHRMVGHHLGAPSLP